jgi:hypothetical protein
MGVHGRPVIWAAVIHSDRADMSLKPHETDLVGGWIFDGKRASAVATCSPKLAERRRKAEAIPIMFWTAATGFANGSRERAPDDKLRSTDPAIRCLTCCLPDGQIS